MMLLKAFRKNVDDIPFMLRDEARSLRLQLEFLKPDVLLREVGVNSTVVIFGSARTLSESQAKTNLREKMKRLKVRPTSSRLKQEVAVAEQILENARYYEMARRFARLVGRERKKYGFVIATGGGDGIMEAANRGSHEVGAKTVGYNITLPHEQVPNPYITPGLCFQFRYFALRKMHFLLRAKALVFFPGGYGTFDELFEILTLIQTERVRRVPVILISRRYWSEMVNFPLLVQKEMITEKDLDIFTFAESADEAWRAIKTFYYKKSRASR